MRFALVAVLLACAPLVRATGENDEDVAIPGLIPTGTFTIFYNTEGPLSFVAMTPKDRPKDARELGTVRGSSCQHGLSVPLSANLGGTSISGAYGDGSFMKAISQIKKEKPDVEGLYDVRTDLQIGRAHV